MSTLPAPRRWWALGVIGMAELMSVLGNAVMNIALPAAQADLAFGDAQRQWVITAYSLAFGSLLLLGGRLVDLLGRRRAFLLGLIGFGTSSALGGLAPDFAVLVTSRALQGAFGALLAPAALSLLTTTFPDGPDRARAFGIFATLASVGSTLGLLLGGVLTEYVDWRWCLFVNVVLAVGALASALVLLPADRSVMRPHLDIPGATTVAAGLSCLVFGFAGAETDGWQSLRVDGFLVAAVVLLAVFVLLQRRSHAPLLPLRVVLDRRRGGAFLTVFVMTAGVFAVNLFLAYVLQQYLGFSAMTTGIGLLPMVGCLVLAANTVPPRLLPVIGCRPLMAAGLASGAGALFWLSMLTVDATYATNVLGPLVLMGLGMGTGLSTAVATATTGVDRDDEGVDSAMVNTMQQVGGSVGTALLSSIAGTASAALVGAPPAIVAVHGYAVAFGAGAAALLAGAVVVGLLVPPRRRGGVQPDRQSSGL